eukprot:1439667-Alexandrium_andersonii.AAC.1
MCIRDSIPPCQGMRRLIPKDGATRAHRVGAFDPLEEGSFNAEVLDPIFPGSDALPCTGVGQRGEVALILLQGGNS